MGTDLGDFKHDGPWIETYTGRAFHILNPQPDEIQIEDIAHALSNQCRFTGHTKRFYSVAEHSYRVSLLVKGSIMELTGLLHDASEAYICDLSRPVKHHTSIGEHYMLVEEKIQNAIFAKFGLASGMPQEVKDADNLLLYTEKAQLMANVQKWERCDKGCGDVHTGDTAGMYLSGYSPIVMEAIFMRRFEELYSQQPTSPTQRQLPVSWSR